MELDDEFRPLLDPALGHGGFMAHGERHPDADAICGRHTRRNDDDGIHQHDEGIHRRDALSKPLNDVDRVG